MKNINLDEKINEALDEVTMIEEKRLQESVNAFFEGLDESGKSRLMSILLGTGAVKKKEDGSFEVVDQEKADSIEKKMKAKGK